MAAVLTQAIPNTLGDTLAQSLARRCVDMMNQRQGRRLQNFIHAMKQSRGAHSRNAAYQRSIAYARATFGDCIVNATESGTNKDRVTRVTGMDPLNGMNGRTVFRTISLNARRPGEIKDHSIGAEISIHALQRLIQDLHNDQPSRLAGVLFPHASQAASEVPLGWPNNREWLSVTDHGIGVWVKTPMPDGVEPCREAVGSPYWMLMVTWIPASTATHGPYGRARQRFLQGLEVNTLKC